MNVDLIDHLVCPRCGPPNGLLLLAHEVRERRVHEGEFGCPNCRDRFPVSGGFGDLRPPPRGEGVGGAGLRAGEAAGDAADRALRIAAALGVTRGPGLIVVTDAHRAEAVHLARLVDGIEVLVVGWGGREMVAEGVVVKGVSAFVAGPRLPLRDGAVRGVVAVGRGGEGWWGEGRRVLMAGGRLVITEATREARDWVGGAGLVTILDEGGMVVGAVPVPSGGLKLTGRSPLEARAVCL
ncbi:MAG: hypothetical protein OXF01_10075 [Gemmatimonadetes bacterium]|nr:hypothetical protein [Gemmatimonadota bacterium]